MLWPHLSVVFRRLVCLGSFPACWRQAKVTPILKGPPSSSVANYRKISITSALCKVFKRLVLVRLLRFMECSGMLPTTQFAYRKGLGTCAALLCMPHTLQRTLESWQEARIVQIDRENLLGILYTLLFGHWRFCLVYIDTVSIKPITARYGGWLSE